jgi:PKD repeat protein
MNLAKLAAALAAFLMMAVLAAPAVSAEKSVDLTATVLEPKPEIGIELSANALDFGPLYPGDVSDPRSITVTNIGLKEIDVTATASDDGAEQLFVPGLLIDGASFVDYSAILAAEESDDTQLTLHVPNDFTARGDFSGGAIYWAEEHSEVEGPVADFSADVTSGAAPLTVQFTDLSTNSPTSWAWDFDGDGTVDSTEQNPSHDFDAEGTYTVSLTASNAGGSDEEIKAAHITVNAVQLNIYSTALENTNPGAPDPGIPGFVGPNGNGKVDGGTVNPAFVAWASTVMDYSPADQSIHEIFANPNKALGPVTGNNFDIVSLGDLYQAQIDSGELPGSLTVGFAVPIADGEGPDLAVFENGFMSGSKLFAELAYVEVSTDGITFARFPSISLNTDTVGGYGGSDPTNLYNLAGKHVNAYDDSWGTPFDLSTLAQASEVLAGSVDLNDINYVRIVDIPGSGDFKDSQGNPIYDAWITTGSGGIDVEAIGVINMGSMETPIAEFTYASSGSAITINGYVGSASKIVIPRMIDGLPVTAIGSNAFKGKTILTSITIPDGVISIGSGAFRQCTALSYVNVPEGVAAIGVGAFTGCSSLVSVIMPDSVTSIGNSAFASCTALTTVALGTGITSLPLNCFGGCTALTTITFNGNAPAVGSGCFGGCASLTIYYREGATGFTTPTWNNVPCQQLGA